jgi:hypothetical protein
MGTLEQQKVSFESIQTFCANYKKDGASRKSQEYLNKQLTALADLWEDFRLRHEVLEQEMEDKTIDYFVGDIYGKTEDMYKSTKGDILDRLRSQNQGSGKGDNVCFSMKVDEECQESEIKLRDLLSRQECNFKAIDRAMSKVDIDDVSQKWELEDHLSILKAKWEPIWELEDHLSILKAKWEPIDRHHWELDAIL